MKSNPFSNLHLLNANELANTQEKNRLKANALASLLSSICDSCQNYYRLDQINRGSEFFMTNISDRSNMKLNSGIVDFTFNLTEARIFLQEFIVSIKFTQVKEFDFNSNYEFVLWSTIKDLLYTINNLPVKEVLELSCNIDTNYLEAFLNTFFPEFQSLKCQPTDLCLAHKQNMEFYKNDDIDLFNKDKNKFIRNTINFLVLMFETVEQLLDLIMSPELLQTWKRKFNRETLSQLEMIVTW